MRYKIYQIESENGFTRYIVLAENEAIDARLDEDEEVVTDMWLTDAIGVTEDTDIFIPPPTTWRAARQS